jgi:hypothetical protein
MSQTRTISVRVSERLALQLDAISRMSGFSLSVLTRLAVEEYVAKVKQTGKIEITQIIDVSEAVASALDEPLATAGGKSNAAAKGARAPKR